MQTDINDLGYIYFSVGINNARYMNRDIDNRFSDSVFLGICIYILRFIYYFVKSPWRYNTSLKKEKAVLIYGESTNNRNTLLPIIKELGDNKVIDLFSHSQYPKWKQYWYAIPYLGSLLKELRNANSDKRCIIRYFFAKFWVMYGCNKAAGELLDFYKPSILVMANDHLHFHRALMHEAKKRGIYTLYVQHASVTDKFPPLEFDFSLLDGEDSYNKYNNHKNNSGNIYLTGGIRFDGINISKQNLGGKTVIGVAINQFDDETIVKGTCLQLKSFKFNDPIVEVILRPHPQMPIKMWSTWCKKNNVGFSFAREETSFQFLSRISVLISNQCSIHLDAAMCHTPSIIFKLSSSNIEDSYLFSKNGLAIEAHDMRELSCCIQESRNRQPSETAVKYYNCSYCSNYEGQVAKLMADLIQCIPDKLMIFNKKYKFISIEENENKHVYCTR